MTFRAKLRRALGRARREPEITYLNIVPMLDIVTIILVFLLKSMGESSAATPQSDDLRLPASVIRTNPSDEGIVVTVSKTEILVGDQRVLRLPGRRSLASSGAGAAAKRGGPNDLYIVPLGTALDAARRTDKLLRERRGLDASQSEAIVIADETTPYRLLSEVLFTLGQREFGRYHLMVLEGS
jgi:biopolymer transport protein ExbD